MFTGLVEACGEVVALDPHDGLVRATIHGPRVTADAALGDSIAVNGVCLTVTDLAGDGAFTVDIIGETLRRSTLGTLVPGARVNLERALALGDRLGGHLVQGHVDAVAPLVKRRTEGEWQVLRFALPESIAPLVVAKGSITVHGVSLTVSAVSAPHDADAWFEVSLIPATLRDTTLGALEHGQSVNLESDLVARHLERLAAFARPA